MTLDEQQKSRDAVEQAVRSLFDAYEQRTPEAMAAVMSVYTDSFFGVGTGVDEIILNKGDMAAVIERDFQETPDGIRVTIHDMLVRMHSDTVAGVLQFLTFSVQTPEGPVDFSCRYTWTWQFDGQEWKAVSAHASVPSALQAEGEAMPTDALRAEAKRLEKEVAERTAELQHANRALAVDASIERIRRVTAGMNDPADLIEVVKQIKREIDALYQVGMLEVSLMFESDEETVTFWSILDVAEVPEDLAQFGLLYPKKPDPPHPLIDRVLASKGAYSVRYFDLDELWQVHASLAHYVPHEAEMLKAALDSGEMEQGWLTVSAIQDGWLYLGWAQEPPQELETVQPRIAAVLSDAQKRVEELQAAHRMAREAEIEAALERVRGRALAMRSSEELTDVSLELRHQMGLLGQKDLEVCGIHLYEVDPDMFESWGAMRPPGSDGDILTGRTRLPKKGVEVMEECIAKYESDETDYVVINEGEKAHGFMEMMKRYAPEVYRMLSSVMSGQSDPPTAYWSFSDFDGGSLLMVTYQPADKDSRDLLRRCANVFDLAYRRFLDLKEAEEAEREAQVEASLERVRSRSMAMHDSDELHEVAQVLFQQLVELGLRTEEIETCGIAIFKDGGPVVDTFVTMPDGSTYFTFTVEYGGDPPSSGFLKAWREKKPLHMEALMGQALPDHLDYLTQQSGLPINKFHEHAGKEMPAGSYNYAANFEHGYVAVITTEPQEHAEELYPRFARVFEQAYTRFLDLKNAEAATREAQIETALERIRSKTMGMQKSEELSDISLELVKQVQELGDKTWFCAFNIYDDDPRGSVEWGSNGRGTFPMYRTPREGIFLRYYEAGQKGESFLVNEIGEDECPDHYEYLCSLPGVGEQLLGMKAKGIPFPSSQIDHVAFFKYGYVLFITYDPVPESHDIFKRFAKVFEQSYTRFLDLQKAEAQAREAQIENALERIRSRTMGMQMGEELNDVVVLLYKELIALGVTNFVTCGYVEIHEDKQIQDTWVTSPGGDTFGLFYLPLQGDATFEARYAAWKKQAPIFHQTVAGQERSDHLEYAITKFNSKEAEEMVRSQFPDPTVFYCFNFSHGYLHTVGGSLLEKDEELLIARFTKVFEQTYTRFLDLQKAEAQARDAQIEAALERVRSKAMGMQKPEDISDVSIRMFEELEDLGIESLRSGIAIPGDGEQYVFRSATKDEDGKIILVLGGGSIDVHPFIRRAYDCWRKQETHQITILEGDDLTGYYNAVFDLLPEPDQKARMQQVESVKEWFATFSFQDGWLYTFKRDEYSADELDLYERFARVFGLAYQRYHDLTKAEKDYEALLEEKARTEKALSDLQATQKQLVEQEKLASLGSLTAGIAHEIKNPLNFVNNFAEVSQELVDELAEAIAAGDTEEAQALMADLRSNAEQIAKHGGRADSIVKSMMQHARGGASEREMVDVNAFIGEYIDLAWHGMRAKDHTFECEVIRAMDPDAGSFTVQPQDLGRVVLNLLNNAFYAVRMDGAAQKPVVRLETGRSEDKKNVTIKVTDSGPGIPGDVLEKIFEPFFTTKPTGEGTGLGLSLSHDIVTKGHGGTMTAENGPNGGAEFTIMLPGGDA